MHIDSTEFQRDLFVVVIALFLFSVVMVALLE
jgi:hypothetical protein